MKKVKNTQGILLMLLSMVAFAIADTLVKVLTLSISPAQVLFFLITGGLIAFAAVAIVLNETLLDRRAFAPILILRYVSEIIGMTGMVMALAYVPLSTVGAITQATPILVAVGAVFFLGEKVSWRRWSCIAIGFLGVLLIIQPAGDGFDIMILWAVLAMVAMSVRDLTTRLAPTGMASSSLATYTMVAALPFTIMWVLFNGEKPIPDDVNWILVIIMTGSGAFGYLLLTASIRMAQVSVVTPFRYTRILFLLVLGVAVFDERPSGLMLMGATMIILSGIYMVWREQQLKRIQQQTRTS